MIGKNGRTVTARTSAKEVASGLLKAANAPTSRSSTRMVSARTNAAGMMVCTTTSGRIHASHIARTGNTGISLLTSPRTSAGRARMDGIMERTSASQDVIGSPLHTEAF